MPDGITGHWRRTNQSNADGPLAGPSSRDLIVVFAILTLLVFVGRIRTRTLMIAEMQQFFRSAQRWSEEVNPPDRACGLAYDSEKLL
jgi:hypothetical protein